MASLLNDFYGALSILNKLDPANSARIVPRSRAWHRFIDDLCLLCDFHTGGKSVTSIAVEDAHDHLVFWITANGGPKDQAVNHLRWLLSMLSEPSDISMNSKADQIIQKSAALCDRRVANYAKWLRRWLEQAESLCADGPNRGNYKFHCPLVCFESALVLISSDRD